MTITLIFIRRLEITVSKLQENVNIKVDDLARLGLHLNKNIRPKQKEKTQFSESQTRIGIYGTKLRASY